MKFILSLIAIILTFASCKSKVKLEEDLPKDIVWKKVLTENYSADSAKLQNLQSEIKELIAQQICDDASQWKISAMGSKSCGGPAYYIAYPKDLEIELLPKIKNYTNLESGFNERYGIVSNCMIEKEPSAVICEDGIAVLE